jgi:hypothetical protein
MNARFRITGLALAALTLPFHAGCRGQPNAPSRDPVVQTVRIEPAEPREGETVTVLSSIENRGSRPEHVTYRICTLGLGGDLVLAMPPGTVRCAAVSGTSDLAPGQRVEMSDMRVVVSGAGVYTLTVNHLVDPQRTTTLKVRVRV